MTALLGKVDIMIIHFGLHQFRALARALCWGALLIMAVIGIAIAQPAPPLPECTCRAQGRTYHLGENICLRTPEGYRLAECELTQNITNWRFSKNTCTISDATTASFHEFRVVEACVRKST